MRTGCPWRYLPVDFQRWNRRGVTQRLFDELCEQVRIAQGRAPQPTAALIDSQSVRAADTVNRDTRGYDADKKTNGRKRFIVADTLGLLITVMVVAASVQHLLGAKAALLGMYLATPARLVFADAGFTGKLVDWTCTILATTLHIMTTPADHK